MMTQEEYAKATNNEDYVAKYGEPIIDLVTGYPINRPMGILMPPGWWKTDRQAVQRIMEAREVFSIVIEDDLIREQ